MSKPKGTESFQEYGRNLLTTVVRMFKIACVHHLENRAVEPIINEVLEMLNPRLNTGERLQLQYIGETVFLSRQMLKLRGDSYLAAVSLRAMYKRLGISEVAFHSPLTGPELRQFLAAFQKHYQSPTPRQFLHERFPKITIRFIKPGSAEDFSERDKHQAVVRSYAQLVVSTRECLAAGQMGRRPSLDAVRRAVQTLVINAEGNDAVILGLTRFDNQIGDTAFHATVVATLVVLMGRRLGMPRALLMELCLAALFHAAGRVDLPQRADGSAVPVEEYFLAARRVPLSSMLHIAKVAPSLAMLDRLAVAFEASLPVRAKAGAPVPGVLARLIAVPSAFDLLTSPPRPRKGLLPDQALRVIMENAGRRFDPDVVQLFAATVGLYPVGTVVQLSGGQEAVVTAVPKDAQHASRPVVKVFKDPARPMSYTLDLSLPNEKLRIVRSLNARDRDVNVPHYLTG